jgi:hypothetical protein
MRMSDEQLVRRVDPTAEDAVKDVVQRAGHAPGLLKASWQSTFRREPDPAAAYRDAKKVTVVIDAESDTFRTARTVCLAPSA